MPPCTSRPTAHIGRARAQAGAVPAQRRRRNILYGSELDRSAHRTQVRGRHLKGTVRRVLSTQLLPLTEVRKVEPLEQQAIDDVAQQDLGKWILAIGRIEQLLDGDFSKVEQFIARERGLVFLELFLDPGVVTLARSFCRCRHRVRKMYDCACVHKVRDERIEPTITITITITMIRCALAHRAHAMFMAFFLWRYR